MSKQRKITLDRAYIELFAAALTGVMSSPLEYYNRMSEAETLVAAGRIARAALKEIKRQHEIELDE